MVQKNVNSKINAGKNDFIEKLRKLAEWTGLEPATPCVTGRYSNQLNYHSAQVRCIIMATGHSVNFFFLFWAYLFNR